MLGKILQLRGIPLKDGFEVEDGICVCQGGTADFGFATITLKTIPEKAYSLYICSVTIVDIADGFKKIFFEPMEKEDIPEALSESYLLVIIPYASAIETTATKIAGRYPTEAILEMHSGDTVKVNKPGAEPETYMAVRADNEMFLVKKNR